MAVKALAPEIPHKAKLGGVQLGLRTPVDAEVAAAEVLQAAARAGAGRPQVLVQQMVSGDEVLVGAVVDDRYGALITMRPGGALAEAGDAMFVPCPLTPKQALDVSSPSRRPTAGSTRIVTTCRRPPRRSRAWRGRLTIFGIG